MDTDLQFGILLKRVFYLWHQVINERLRPRGMSHSQWRVVLELSRSPAPMTQSALAGELGVEAPTMVRLIDRLADKGWLAREACPADRRARLVRLTPRAQKLARELEEVVGEVRRELLHDPGWSSSPRRSRRSRRSRRARSRRSRPAASVPSSRSRRRVGAGPSVRRRSRGPGRRSAGGAPLVVRAEAVGLRSSPEPPP